ncbi:MAG: coiled-coil domain-containing protein, partial [Endomicrobiales bacterium]
QQAEKLAAREAEISTLRDKEGAARLALDEAGQKIREQEETLSAWMQEVSAEREKAVLKENEFKAQFAQLEQKLEAGKGELACAREEVKAMAGGKAEAEEKLAAANNEAARMADVLAQEKASAAHAENEYRKERAQLAEKLAAREAEVMSWQEKENTARQAFADKEHRVRELEETLAARARDLVSEREKAVVRENELKGQLAQWAEKCAARDTDLARVTEEMIEGTGKRNLAEQKAAGLENEAVSLKQALTLERQRAAQKDEDVKKEVAQWAERLTVRDRELAGWIEKDRDNRLSIAAYEQKLRDLGETINALMKNLETEHGKTAQKENEMARLQEKIEQGKTEKEMAVKAAGLEKQHLLMDIERLKEEAQLAAQLSEASKKDAVAARNETLRREEEMQALKEAVEKGKAEKEAALMAAEQEKQERGDEAKALEKEIVRLTHEAQLKEKDLALALKDKDAEQAVGAAKLTERIEWLESKLANFQQDLDREIAEHGKSWKRREEALLAELREKDGVFGALQQEKEKLARAYLEFEEKNQAELMSLQRQFSARKEELKASEEALRRELNEKYRQQILQLEEEKEELARDVAKEVRAIKVSMQGELDGMEEHMTKERAEWENAAGEREKVVIELRQKIEALTGRIAEADLGRKDLEARLSDERRKWEAENQSQKEAELENQVSARLREQSAQLQAKQIELECRLAEKSREMAALKEQFERLAAGNGSGVQGYAQNVVLPAQGALQDKDSLITRFWRNINEPVIEIDFKKDADRKRLS